MEQLTAQHQAFLNLYYSKIRDFEFELAFWRDVTKGFKSK